MIIHIKIIVASLSNHSVFPIRVKTQYKQKMRCHKKLNIIVDNPMFIKKTTPILKDDTGKGSACTLKFITGNTHGYLFGMYQQCFYELYDEHVFYLIFQTNYLSYNQTIHPRTKYALLYHDIIKHIYKISNSVLFHHRFADTHETHILIKELDDFENLTNN